MELSIRSTHSSFHSSTLVLSTILKQKSFLRFISNYEAVFSFLKKHFDDVYDCLELALYKIHIDKIQISMLTNHENDRIMPKTSHRSQ